MVVARVNAGSFGPWRDGDIRRQRRQRSEVVAAVCAAPAASRPTRWGDGRRPKVLDVHRDWLRRRRSRRSNGASRCCRSVWATSRALPTTTFATGRRTLFAALDIANGQVTTQCKADLRMLVGCALVEIATRGRRRRELQTSAAGTSDATSTSSRRSATSSKRWQPSKAHRRAPQAHHLRDRTVPAHDGPATRSTRPRSSASSAGSPRETFESGLRKTVRWYFVNRPSNLTPRSASNFDPLFLPLAPVASVALAPA